MLNSCQALLQFSIGAHYQAMLSPLDADGLADRFNEAFPRDGATSDVAIAKACGVTPQAVTGWRRTGRIAKKHLSVLSRLSSRSLSWWLGGLTVPSDVEGPPIEIHREDVVPVVGTVQAGDDGYWEELQYPVGHGDGFIRYPSRDPNAYALRVKGDSMRPRIKPGEFILVEPNTALIPGEEVLITTTDGRSMVKLLGPRRDGMIELQSINEDHRPITVEETQIRAMHYVSAIVKPSRYYRDA